MTMIRATSLQLKTRQCVHVWIEDGEKCLVGCTSERYPVVDEWEQPLYCEKCGETTLRWVSFELDKGS
jgi:hypothetical protein